MESRYNIIFKSVLTFIVLVLLSLQGQSQSLVKPGVSTGLLTGGRASSSTFYFRGGVGGYFSLQLKRPDQLIYPSFTIGVEKLTEETLVPVGAAYTVLFSDRPYSGYLIVGGGYALSFHEAFENISGYEYYGGAFFNPGWGYRWLLKSGSELFVQTRYRHQFLRAEYEVEGVEQYTERFQYMMLQLTTGLIF